MTVSEPSDAPRPEREKSATDSAPSVESTPVPVSSDVPGESASAPVREPSPASPEPNVSATEGLPEWEPLTPELVEDEAIRGDFMLRWAMVLLALLIGCRQIVETT